MADDMVVRRAGKVRLRVNSRSGRVRVVFEGRDDILLTEGAHRAGVKTDDTLGEVTIEAGSTNIEVRCPVGTDLIVGTLSSNVEVRGAAGAVTAGTASGNVSIESASSADVRTLSGRIEVGSCSGRCRMATKSGRAFMGNAGAAEVSSASGKVEIEQAAGPVHVKAVSGSVVVALTGPHDVSVETMSGGVTVRVPAGVHPNARLRSLSGEPRCDVPAGMDCEVRVASMSGKISVVAE